MWTYKSQIILRWISFILGVILLAVFLASISENDSLTQTGLKILLTKYQIWFEALPVWSYLTIILASILLLFAGIPTVCIVFPLLLLKGCTFAFIVGASCQIVTTLLAMWISYKREPVIVSPSLSKSLSENQSDFQSFAFWSRVYYNIPLRTIDRLTPLVHNDKEALFSSLIAASSAILIRICIPTLLLKYIIDQFTLLAHNPTLSSEKLIFWAIVLITYTLLPKMPEVMICPDKVKKVIFELESTVESTDKQAENNSKNDSKA